MTRLLDRRGISQHSVLSSICGIRILWLKTSIRDYSMQSIPESRYSIAMNLTKGTYSYVPILSYRQEFSASPNITFPLSDNPHLLQVAEA